MQLSMPDPYDPDFWRKSCDWWRGRAWLTMALLLASLVLNVILAMRSL